MNQESLEIFISHCERKCIFLQNEKDCLCFNLMVGLTLTLQNRGLLQPFQRVAIRFCPFKELESATTLSKGWNPLRPFQRVGIRFCPFKESGSASTLSESLTLL